jgi:uridine kinase
MIIFIINLMENKSTFEEISHIIENRHVDEFDILDPMIFEYYKEEQRKVAEFASENVILIDGKLGLNKDSLPEIFKACKPIAKSFRSIYKPFNELGPQLFT